MRPENDFAGFARLIFNTVLQGARNEKGKCFPSKRKISRIDYSVRGLVGKRQPAREERKKCIGYMSGTWPV